jgi:hypothetical protein
LQYSKELLTGTTKKERNEKPSPTSQNLQKTNKRRSKKQAKRYERYYKGGIIMVQLCRCHRDRPLSRPVE